jgi:hypothetical protein
VSKWGELNWQFHATLYAPAERPITMGIVQRLHQQSDRYLRMQLALTHGETRANDEHRAIAAAARAKDVKRACALVRDHIAGAGRSLIAFLRRQLDDDVTAPTPATIARRARNERMTAHTSGVAANAPRLQSFIGGTWADSTGDAWITDRNPSNANDIVAYVPEGVADEARRAAGRGGGSVRFVVVAYGRGARGSSASLERRHRRSPRGAGAGSGARGRQTHRRSAW